MTAIVYLNGSYLDQGDAGLSVAERGFLYGQGLFETLAAYQREVFQLDSHLDRLRRSAEALAMPVPFTNKEAIKILAELIQRNELTNAYIRITLAAGTAPGMVPDQPGEPTILIVARPPVLYPPELYEDGARTVTTPYYLGPLSCHKTLSYLPNIRARTDARAKGADEAILFDRRGNPAEGSASNIFIVKEGTVVTPPLDSGVLPGITRENVLRICAQEGIPLEERTILLDQLRSADEMFLTNTLMQVMPVASIDDITFPAARPLTHRIAACYKKLLPS